MNTTLVSTEWDLDRSAFRPVIHTNHVPSTEELAQLKDLLVRPQLNLSRVESEISRMQAALNELQSERDTIRNYIAAHRALMSPIRRLPSETLAEIFISCLPTDRHPVRDLKEAPLLLTTICRTWRETAVTTPMLWRSLHIHVPSPPPSPELPVQRTEGTDLWLRRSGSLPISLSLHVDINYHDLMRPNPTLLAFLRTLMRYSSRFAEISLSLSESELASFVSLAPQDFPALILLKLRGDESSRFDPQNLNGHQSACGPLIARCPMLTGLTLEGFNNLGSRYLSLPVRNWGDLTQLTLHTMNEFGLPGPILEISQVLQLLARTPRLQMLNIVIGIRTRSIEGSLPGPGGTVHLNDLREMKLTFLLDQDEMPIPDETAMLTGAITQFQETAVCPSLKLLSARWQGRAFTEFPFAELFLANLETLILEMSLTQNALSSCLARVPELTRLVIYDLGAATCANQGLEADPYIIGEDYDIQPQLFYNRSLQDSHLRSLTPSNENPFPLCPKLRCFRLVIPPDTWNTPNNISTDALVCFLEARASARMHALASCEVLFTRRQSFSPKDLETLRKLKEDGLKLCVSYVETHPSGPAQQDTPTAGLLPYEYGDTSSYIRDEDYRRDTIVECF